MAPGTDIFLSHNWGKDETGRDNHERVSIISKELQKIGYQTWFDPEHMRGGIVEKMSQGIEETKGVVVFITRWYHDKVNSMNASDNCQLEFNYASRKKTRLKMVAVVMEKCMGDTSRWTGSIGMHLGGEMYVDMSGDLKNRTYLNEQMKVLQNELQSKGIQPAPGNLSSCFIFQYCIIVKKSLVFSLQNISLKDLQNCISILFAGDHYFVQYELMLSLHFLLILLKS